MFSDYFRYEKPPLLFHAAVSGLFNITAFVQRFFLLPRTSGKFMVRLKSEGYRIEELVSDLTRFCNTSSDAHTFNRDQLNGQKVCTSAISVE